jgi:dihydroxy-acid dehydratase
MRPPDYLLKRDRKSLPWALPCIGDGRQSGTSASPSILNASPEAAVGGGLALLQTGDRVRIDLNKRTADILISGEELQQRREAFESAGGYKYPESQTPWQEIHREYADQLSNGMVLKNAVSYQRIAETMGLPRENF